jgi:hypothetical protein
MSSFFPADPGPAARRTALALLVSLFALAEPAAAAWENGYWATVFTPTDSAEKAVCADGQGGTLVAMFDATASLLRVHVSRLAPDGTELWGDGGVAVPFDVYSDEQQDPVDVAPDGTGGAYVAFQEIWGTTHYLTLAHFDNDGSLDWVMPKADFHYQGGALGLRVVAASGGEAILVWPDDPVDTLAPEKLLAMRVDGTGATSWTVAVNQTIDVFDSPSAWDVSSDGMGGVLVAWNAYDSVSTLHAKIQRITAAGSVLWGSDGHDIPGWIGPTRVLPDGAGGGYVVTSLGFGETYGQRIDVNGNARWGSGGILLQDAATYPNPCSFDICVSGGDLHLVQGVTDLYVQRVDLYGNKQWGANGLAITSRAGWQDGASIDSDGQNGVIVAYQDHYYSAVSDPYARALSVTRLDLTGAKVYESLGAWFSDLSTNRISEGVDVVGGGDGSAHVVWLEGYDDNSDDEVYAMGLGASGGVTAVDDGATPTRLVGPEPHPNPFNPRTSLAYTLPAPGHVRLTLLDLRGRLVRTLVDADQAAGRHDATWRGRDRAGAPVGSGVYVARLEYGGKARTRKIVLAR